jgi:hypothetical protein
MSTQRRFVLGQRFIVPAWNDWKPSGTADTPSMDAGIPVPGNSFGGFTTHRTAFLVDFFQESPGFAQHSLSISSCCEWQICHGYPGTKGAISSFFEQIGVDGSSPASGFNRAGILPEQLPSISPLLLGNSELDFSAQATQSALPRVLKGTSPRTERQYGQGNLYLQHTARDAAGDFGRRSTR